MKTVLISGSGSGMGLLTAQTLLKEGYAVYAGVRDPDGRSTDRRDALQASAREVGGEVHVVDMDIHSEDSCRAAVAQVIADHGRLDVVVHNAAHLYIGVGEAFTPEQLADSFNTNVIGAHRLNRAALPHMRAQEAGVLLYVGSTITRIVTPFLVPYITGKYALDALAEVTAYELHPFGIETVILMPGLFPDGTSHFATAVYPADKDVADGYARVQADYDGLNQGLRNLLRGGDAPVQGVADEIARVLALPKGEKPMRPLVDYADYGAEAINAVAEAQTERVFRIMDMDRLLKVA
jgi:NAD(P)-dependent dehydrogenase (short-subunit alcohol dehydrogenase family)